VVLQRLPELLSESIFAGTDIIIPVPLSKKRLFERGFNQAETIATRVSRVVQIPVDSASLIRKKHTPMHRAAMDKKAREMTVTNAFEVVRPRLIDGRSILLVDDIFTSGATASHCAKALKKKGAANVKVFTLARAIS
jgi:ComF family protein